jgi:hypothetical protein
MIFELPKTGVSVADDTTARRRSESKAVELCERFGIKKRRRLFDPTTRDSHAAGGSIA